MSRHLRPFLLLVLVLLIDGCDERPHGFVDADWHRKDLQAQLQRWVDAPAQQDLTLHSRLIYAMAIGYQQTGDKRCLERARRDTDLLLTAFTDPQYGGFYARLGPDGKPLNPSKNTYGHAFALLALSTMARVTHEQRYAHAALAAWHDIVQHLRDEDGGFRADAPRDWGPSHDLRSQNPLMHMFEAQLALIDATGDKDATADAASVARFVTSKLMVGLPDGGAYIPEWYDEHWTPLPTREKGAYIDLGHQFEWSHLLKSAADRGLPVLYADVGDRLLAYGLRKGYDENDGGVFNRVYPDGEVDRDKFWWEQCEGARALMRAAADSKRSDLVRRYRQTVDLIREQVVDASTGAWRNGTKRTCDHDGCGKDVPEPYHMIALHEAALKLAAAP